jgi:hypothetical protein
LYVVLMEESDPAQADKNDQADQVKAKDGADGNGLLFNIVHIEHPEGDEEEGQVADEEDKPGGGSALRCALTYLPFGGYSCSSKLRPAAGWVG